MTLILYQTTAENNRLNKSAYTTSLGSVSGTMLEGSSIDNPKIKFVYNGTPASANYFYVTEFVRYYYRTDIAYVGGNVWEISGVSDPLYTYNTAIRSCTAFVTRNENEYDKNQFDAMRPMKNNVGYHVAHGSCTSGNWSQAPAYWKCMLAVQGSTTAATAGTPVFVGSSLDIQTILSAICRQPEEGVSYEHYASEYIVNGWRLPFTSVPVISSALVYFPGVTFPASVGGSLWTGVNVNATFTVSVTTEATTADPWKALSPASDYYLSFAPFGVFPLSDDLLFTNGDYTTASILCKVVCDVSTGDAVLLVAPTGTSYYRVLASANIASDLPCNAVGNSVRTTAGSNFNTVLSRINTAIDNVGSSLPIVGNFVSSLYDMVSPSHASFYGTTGGAGYVDSAPYLWCTYHNFGDAAAGTLGLPLHKEMSLSGLSGFTVASAIHLDGVPATMREKSDIEKAFAEGVIL